MGGRGEEESEHESIKSIQLRHEMQGSLSMSKPMKMTIHQERECCGSAEKLVQACARTTYSITMEKMLILACLKTNVN